MTETITKEKSQQERVITKRNSPLTLKIAGAGIFAALSLIVSLLTTKYLPRVQWGLALFDPVSIIWIAAFFIFGYETGIITSVLGMFLLMPFDDWTPWGPIMKFTATIPLIIIPLLLNLIKKKPLASEMVLENKKITFNWILAVVVRLIVMVIFNIVIINMLFGGDAFALYQDLGFMGLPGITGWNAVIGTVIVINALQSVWDYLLSVALVKAVFSGRRTLPW